MVSPLNKNESSAPLTPKEDKKGVLLNRQWEGFKNKMLEIYVRFFADSPSILTQLKSKTKNDNLQSLIDGKIKDLSKQDPAARGHRLEAKIKELLNKFPRLLPESSNKAIKKYEKYALATQKKLDRIGSEISIYASNIFANVAKMQAQALAYAQGALSAVEQIRVQQTLDRFRIELQYKTETLSLKDIKANITHLEKQLGEKINPTQIFNHPEAALMAEYNRYSLKQLITYLKWRQENISTIERDTRLNKTFNEFIDLFYDLQNLEYAAEVGSSERLQYLTMTWYMKELIKHECHVYPSFKPLVKDYQKWFGDPYA